MDNKIAWSLIISLNLKGSQNKTWCSLKEQLGNLQSSVIIIGNDVEENERGKRASLYVPKLTSQAQSLRWDRGRESKSVYSVSS